MATTAIAACALMVICGASNFSTAFGQYAASSMVLLLGIMVVGAGMTESGVAQAIAGIVTRYSRSDERKIIAIAYIISYALSAFMATSSVLAMFMAILFGMNTKDGKINHRNLIMPILVSSIFGGISTLVGSTQQVFANGLIEPLGYQFKVFDFLPTGLILGVIGFVYCVFFGYRRGRKIWGDREDDGSVEMATVENKPVDKRKFYTMIGIMIFMVVGFVTEFISAAMTATVAGVLCIITGCVSQKKAITSINWNVLGRLGGVLGLSKVLTAAGTIDLMSGWVQSIVGTSMSPWILFAVCVLLAQLLSMVLFNSTAILLVLSFVLTLAEPMGLNPVAFAFGITMGASVVFSSPLAGTSNQMTMAAGYKFKDFIRYGLPIDIAGYLVLIIFVPMFFPLTLG
ncbi:MAG: anion permease [Clostridia bacterium]|nr:anion permease [Clostridia bacterium]